MRRSTRSNLALGLALLALSGCRGCTSSRPPVHLNPNMLNQPRYEPQASSAFFYNGQAMRPPVPGTVARHELRDHGPYWTGKDASGAFVTAIPRPPVDPTARPVDAAAVLARGKQRFEIYCAACHDKGGDGKGILFERGKVPTPSFHDDQRRRMPDGQIFDTITNGTGLMPSYRYPIPVDDRWAIIVYLRALQAHRLERTGGTMPPQVAVAPTPPAPPAGSAPPQQTSPQQTPPAEEKKPS
jgi:mono/diheme cytochrome c family protein